MLMYNLHVEANSTASYCVHVYVCTYEWHINTIAVENIDVSSSTNQALYKLNY